jgi:hypothetical protein|tara:strand:- start:1714 stop:2118 length:405 start_codon:yes stop_codon:yes gene_type:complete
MNLKQLIVETKVVTVPFEGIDGFEVKIAALSRELSRKIRTESETTKIDPKLRMPVTELDQDKFVEKFSEAAIKGWSGLKYKHLSELLLIDSSQIEDLEAEVEFSIDNVVQLVSHSQIFDTWINEQVFSLHRFRD